MSHEIELEVWKLSIARASAYIQSNASFQIQMFGFYISAVLISYGTSNPSNQPYLLTFIIPVLSLSVLASSCFYFNRLTVQHVFIRLFGEDIIDCASHKSADALWTFIVKERQSQTFINNASNFFGANFTGPYLIFFLIYCASGSVSFWYGLILFSRTQLISMDPSSIYFVLWYASVAAISSFAIVTLLTNRAWKAIKFEEDARKDPSLLKKA